MPRSFLLTNRRYIPTPPPEGVAVDDDNEHTDNNDNDNDNNNNRGEGDKNTAGIDRSSSKYEEEVETWMDVGVGLQEVDSAAETLSSFSSSSCSSSRPSTELMVAHILLRQAEQTEAVNLALDKPCPPPVISTPFTPHHTIIYNNNNNTSNSSAGVVLKSLDCPTTPLDKVVCGQYNSLSLEVAVPPPPQQQQQQRSSAAVVVSPSANGGRRGGGDDDGGCFTHLANNVVNLAGSNDSSSVVVDGEFLHHGNVVLADPHPHPHLHPHHQHHHQQQHPRPTVIYSVNHSSSSNYVSGGYSPNHLDAVDIVDISSNNSNNSSSNNTTELRILQQQQQQQLNHNVGIDLSMKGDPRSPPPPPPPPQAPLPAPSSSSSSSITPLSGAVDGEGQDRSGLSDGDSDSGCSTQNEARSQLPPEVEYGWAECQAHFSLLYDLMTQSGRKLPGKENEQASMTTTVYGGGGCKDEENAANASVSAAEHLPYDYSQTGATSPTREAGPVPGEPAVLYELMTESPRTASGRDVPEHAMEVEVTMQPYHPPSSSFSSSSSSSPPHQTYHQLQPQGQLSKACYHHPQQSRVGGPRPQYDDHHHHHHHQPYRRASLQEVAYDRGLLHGGSNSNNTNNNNINHPAPPPPPPPPPAPRYEPRRSLNDLLFAAGLPPVSPPSPPASLSPSSSPSSSSSSSSSAASPGEDPHACEECGKRYSTSSNLARHRQTHRSQGDKKARKCPHCDKVYVSMPAFSMHVRTHNQGCACPHCGKRFSRPWLLQGHIRTHTGEKPFACPQCGKSFADKSNLRAHIQTHSSEKPYVCGRCGKAFALKSYLYKHEESSCMRGERFRPLRRQVVSAEC